MWRGTSPLVTLSSIEAGRSASGVMPACSSSCSRRGEAEASTSFGRKRLGAARVRAGRCGATAGSFFSRLGSLEPELAT